MDRTPRSLATMAVVLYSAFGAMAEAQGQAPRSINPNAPKLVVVTFKSSDKKLGPDAAEMVRDKISGDVSYRSLYVVPKNDINATLEASGYSTTDALSPSDANLLSKQLRGDEYIEGIVVAKGGAGYSMEAWVVLTRDPSLVQPLGSFDAAKLDQVADKVSRAYQDMHNKTYDNEKRCRTLSREGKPADALKEAESGIKAFPKSTWLRYCELQIAKDQKKPSVELLKIVDDIRANDSKSKIALREAVGLYDELGKNDTSYRKKKIEVLMALREADPTNATLIAQIGAELAASGQMDVALPMVEKAVVENPGDVNLIKLYFAILGATNNVKKMVAVGEDLAKMDTSVVDQGFFDKMISASVSDSNYAKAVEWASKATTKFPKVPQNWVARGQLERRNGQSQQSVESFKRALSLDPKAEGARIQIINSFVEAAQYDSVFTGLSAARKAGEDGNTLGSLAVTVGNRLYRAASALDPKTIDAYKKAMPFLAFGDSVSKDPQTRTNAKYLTGVSSFAILQIAATDAPKTKSCELARTAADALLSAQMNLPAGGAMDPKTVQQLLSYLPQFEGPVAGQVKAFCK